METPTHGQSTRQARVEERPTRQTKVKRPKSIQKSGLGKLRPGGRHEAASTQHFLKSMGVTGPKLRKALKDLTEEAEQRSFRLWLRRKDQAWGKESVLASAAWGQRQGDVPAVAQQVVICLSYQLQQQSLRTINIAHTICNWLN